MPAPHVLRYKLSTVVAVTLVATVILLAWFASVFVRDAAFTEFATTSVRGNRLAGLPRPLVAVVFGGLALLVLALLGLQARAVRAGRDLAVVDDDGIEHHGLLGRTRRLGWDQIARAQYSTSAAIFYRAPDAAGPRSVTVPMAGRDRTAFQAAVRARRPSLAPPA